MQTAKKALKVIPFRREDDSINTKALVVMALLSAFCPSAVMIIYYLTKWVINA